jgi:hypothetical protein
MHTTFKKISLYLTNKNVKMSIISLMLAEGQIFSVLPASSRVFDDIEPATFNAIQSGWVPFMYVAIQLASCVNLWRHARKTRK